MPRVPRATTVRPITAPLEKATRRALERLVLAACVVRTAAPVAVRIPTHPALADSNAPTRNAIAVNPERKAQSTTNITTTKPDKTVYSVFRNAIAPLRMSAAIRCICSVPAECPLICLMRKSANSADTMGAPQPSTKKSCCSIQSSM